MPEAIITHGAIHHEPGADCKICDRKLKARKTEPVNLVPESANDPETAPMFTQSQAADMLEEVQKTTTARIFQKLYDMLDQKEKDLSFPALRKFELEALEKSYEQNDTQSPGRE